MISATCFVITSILSQTMIHFSDFPVNIWVASFVVYAFYRPTFLQSSVYHCKANKIQPPKITTLFVSLNCQPMCYH